MKFAVATMAALLASGCASYPATPPALTPVTTGSPAPAEQRAPVTILVSIDGFRPDYLQRGATPVLARLSAEGVSASMMPSFPSKTFPNHWTLVTGLVPDHHGIVGNSMDDPARPGAKFTMATADPGWWNTAEPIWVTAEKAGIRTATEFWPGANVAWGAPAGTRDDDSPAGSERPEDWHQYAGAVSSVQRVDAVIDWLRRPAATRPRFMTLYLEAVDHAGHDSGPDSAAMIPALAEVDAAIGRLLSGLTDLGQPANLVIVSDHGMAATSSTRTIALDRVTSPSDYRLVEKGPYASLFTMPGRQVALEQALLRPHEHMQCWRKNEIPARFRYGTNPRIPPYLCLADTGWLIDSTVPTQTKVGGNHGYDNRAPEMQALFIAHGPAFVGGTRLPSFPNTDVTPLLRDLLGLGAASVSDGDDAPFRNALAH
ncbi:ectonucleotide pyrophosphatase/phosphodiesterase [Sphingomonas gellani]|nr:ectonucleotide pyrophosphatase/phosphodiesterase [Sphingomonas gellani]